MARSYPKIKVMNENEILIYHYSSKNEKWYDATKKIIWFMKDENAWKVRFSGREDYYHVSFSKMYVFEHPEVIDFAELYYKGSPCFKVKQLLRFDKRIYKIFHENLQKW